MLIYVTFILKAPSLEIQLSPLHFNSHRSVPSSLAIWHLEKQCPTWPTTFGWTEVWEDSASAGMPQLSLEGGTSPSCEFLHPFYRSPNMFPTMPPQCSFQNTNLILSLVLEQCFLTAPPSQFTFIFSSDFNNSNLHFLEKPPHRPFWPC